MDNDNNSSQQSAALSSETVNSPIHCDADRLGEFAAKLKEEREHWQAIVDQSDKDNPAHRMGLLELERLSRQSPERMLATAKRIEEGEKRRLIEQAEYERTASTRARFSIWDNYIRQRGKRYEACRLDTFEVTCDRQKAAMDALRAFVDNMQLHIEAGRNLVAFGPSGTGKDHLITGMVYWAIRSLEKPESKRYDILWTDGPSLFAKVRAEISNNENESDIVSDLSKCWLLVLSDLLPPSSKLTDFQSDVIYRIIEQRYSRMRPTWLSINVRNRAELDAGLGVAVGDRLIDGAVTIACEWPSYRKAGR